MTNAIVDRVVRNLAESRGCDPTELPPIADSVDPDALEALFGRRGNGGRRNADSVEVTFEHAGRTVRIRDRGRVSVESVARDPAR